MHLRRLRFRFSYRITRRLQNQIGLSPLWIAYTEGFTKLRFNDGRIDFFG
jgi:hypothetical protein